MSMEDDEERTECVGDGGKEVGSEAITVAGVDVCDFSTTSSISTTLSTEGVKPGSAVLADVATEELR